MIEETSMEEENFSFVEPGKEEPKEFIFNNQDLRIFKNILLDPKIAMDFANKHSPDVFLGSSKEIGKLIHSYIKTYKSPPTERILLDKVKKNDDLKDKITSLFQLLPDVEANPVEFSYDLEKLKQTYVQTKLHNLKDNISDDPEAAVSDIEKTLRDIKLAKQSHKQSYQQRGIDEYLPEFHEHYVAKIANPELGSGVKTGYSYLDYVTNGVQPAELLIIAGESASGKSLLLNNIAIQMWMQQNTITTKQSDYTKGCNILYFSLEMPYLPCFRRTLARLADVPIYGLRDSTLTRSEIESLNLASKFIKNFSKKNKFTIVDIPRGVNIKQIEERYLEECAKGYVPDVVIVDYLGLMEDDEEDGDDWLKLGKIAGKVHEFGREYNTRIITAVQLNRATKTKGGDPSELIGMHRIGRSSIILHHANICIQIESRKDEGLRDTFIYHLIKNRDGELGKHEIQKKFAHASIFDIPFIPPEKDEFGHVLSGFDDEDISMQVKKLLGIP